MNILWLVTARSGSKGLHNKNIKLLGGVPLIAWRIQSVKNLGGSIWLSTDSEEYASIGNSLGATVPFIRPSELATDGASHLDVILHAADFANSKGLYFDALCLLQPTSPFCTSKSLMLGIEALKNNKDVNGVVAVKKPSNSSYMIVPDAKDMNEFSRRMSLINDNRRQAMPMEMTPCGAFYFVRWNILLEKRTLFPEKTIPIYLSHPEIIDIDDEWDFAFAEFCLMTGRIDKNLVLGII